MDAVFEQDDPGRPQSRRSYTIETSTACVAIYLATVGCLLLTILHRDDHVFTYPLDDPYIHLSLAQNLYHGHYGINPGEMSSPSSSILWPFLLVPLAAHPWSVYAPLAWNVLFCGLSAWLIGRFADKWMARFATVRFNGLARLGIAVGLMLIANLPGLTFVGMEHGLQILLAVACAVGLTEVFAELPVPAWCLAAAIAGPLVRYENFALVAAVVVTLYGQKRYRAAFLVAILSLVGPALFSFFLVTHGLPALPSSVLVKAKVYAVHRGLIVTGIVTVMRSLKWGILEPAWWDQLLIAFLLLFLAIRERVRPVRFVVGAALITAFLQLTIGRFNWFHRYEVYAIIFTSMIAFVALAQTTQIRYRYLLAGVLAFTWPYDVAIWDTPAAASNIYQQQYQMHRFLADFKGRVVAVNDLGLVSYDRPTGLRILDLWGLASPEASRQGDKNGPWLDEIVRDHGATLVIFYPDWYPDGAPDDWNPLATMCITSRRVSASRKCVVFYSTPLGDRNALQAEVARFAGTLPATVKITLGRDSTDQDEDDDTPR